MLEEIIFEYQSLIHKIEQTCSRLERFYQGHLVCRSGCSHCCKVNRSVLAIEGYFIEQQLREFSKGRIRKMRSHYKKNDQYCPMLWHDRCAVYPARPIICRIQGLPILYVEAEIAFVDYCRLNFTQLPENYEFNKKRIIDIRKFSGALTRFDQQFVEDVLGEKWDRYQRVSLKKILFNRKLC